VHHSNIKGERKMSIKAKASAANVKRTEVAALTAEKMTKLDEYNVAAKNLQTAQTALTIALADLDTLEKDVTDEALKTDAVL
jgi:hypothetical protein